MGKTTAKVIFPPATDWRTTDAQEVAKRRERAQAEDFAIRNETLAHPIFSNFQVKSGSGLTYAVEIRDVRGRGFGCECVDFRINGLGTCKHVEAVLLQLQRRHKKLYRAAMASESDRIEVTLDREGDTVRVLHRGKGLPRGVAKWFGADGRLAEGTPEVALEALRGLSADGLPEIRISQELGPWLEGRRRGEERRRLRREYELRVQSGEWPAQETLAPLFPYQREGMLHLAFTERALLADEMGLGKTIQAIAACALLHRLGQARRVLVVTPASLKSEWEEQIRRFTTLDYRIVYGGKVQRLSAYAKTASVPFFTIVNYEQMVPDALDVNDRLAPDIVVLDEAQRIKNWNTKTAQAVKRLRSRYAFVLTGTPIENRIDELQSLMDFLHPAALGPLFRFNRDFYELDDRGRPVGYRNLDVLHKRIQPYMLRRRKAEVETELPERTDRNHFVPMTDLQRQNHTAHQQQVLKMVNIALRRPLTQPEQNKLQRELAMMRMTCDTNYILDPEDRACPKLTELGRILSDCEENDAKVIVFSEWERMLHLVRELCEKRGTRYAWHTGSVPQKRRRTEINTFKNDPACRVFLSTDSGATGLNLQNASVVVNCDLPWNPARLEQRIARAWRKNQTRPVTIVNLISEQSIEHRMLEILARKQSLATSVLDGRGEVKEIKLRSGRQAFVERLQQLVSPVSTQTGPRSGLPSDSAAAPQRHLPADPAEAFACLAKEKINGALLRCEERFPTGAPHSVILVVVEGNPDQCRQSLAALHEQFFGGQKADPQAPVKLEIVDRATDEAIQKLIAAGVLSLTTRGSRPLLPITETGEPAPLSQAEQAAARDHRSNALRKLKMALVLSDSGFEAESRTPLLEGIHTLGKAWAVERRCPAPENPDQVIQPPLVHCWGESLAPVKAAVSQGAADAGLLARLVELCQTSNP